MQENSVYCPPPTDPTGAASPCATGGIYLIEEHRDASRQPEGQRRLRQTDAVSGSCESSACPRPWAQSRGLSDTGLLRGLGWSVCSGHSPFLCPSASLQGCWEPLGAEQVLSPLSCAQHLLGYALNSNRIGLARPLKPPAASNAAGKWRGEPQLSIQPPPKPPDVW